MEEISGGNAASDGTGPVQCAACRHFSFFDNPLGHNSPHALGRCQTASWDGNLGQWAMFQHPCKNFEPADPPAPDQK